jgi:hypothetical protein
MKARKIFSLLTLVLVVALLWPSTAHAKPLFDDEVIFGGTYTLEEGETQNGDLVIMGGTATLEEGSIVNGDVVLMGGTVKADGTVNGSLVGMGGSIDLGESAVINGDLVTMGATVDRQEGTEIGGEVIQNFSFPFRFPFSSNESGTPSGPDIDVNFNPVIDTLWFFFRMFIWAALAILVMIFFANQADRVASAALDEPVITGGIGLGTAILTPIAMLALVITILLIPVALILVLLLAAAWIFGWVSLGLFVGRRLAKMLDQEWAPAIAAGVGTLILYLVLAGFQQIVPCVGWLPRSLVGLWGLGAVLITLFGTREYPETKAVVEAPKVVDVSEYGAPDSLEEELEVEAEPVSEQEESAPLEEESEPESEDETLPDDGLSSEE